MKKGLLLICTCLLVSLIRMQAEELPLPEEQEEEMTEEEWQQSLDSLEASFTFEYGEVTLQNGLGTITIPEGFKYLDPEQSRYVLSVLWGNPDDSTTLGMLFPQNKKMLEESVWGFDIEYEDIGHVKDNDANKIDYDELLQDLQEESVENNKLREQMGYQPIELIGWAATPYYDKDKKILHWAKELKFGDDDQHTLNYNIRKLGRNGVLVLNAIASMDQLAEVNANLPKVLDAFEFSHGKRYADFNPKVDDVAKWTIGGLVAGKILAKAGFFAVLLKFWKVIAVGIAALGGVGAKFFKGRSNS